mgnify:FL=1
MLTTCLPSVLPDSKVTHTLPHIVSLTKVFFVGGSGGSSTLQNALSAASGLLSGEFVTHHYMPKKYPFA